MIPADFQAKDMVIVTVLRAVDVGDTGSDCTMVQGELLLLQAQSGGNGVRSTDWSKSRAHPRVREYDTCMYEMEDDLPARCYF